MQRNIFLTMFILLISLLLSGCSDRGSFKADSISKPDNKVPVSRAVGYAEKIEGLHVTGTPIDINVDSFRLNITGAVTNERSLTFAEVKNYDSKTAKIELNCPGLFTDIGEWTGVPLSTLLIDAGIDSHASNVSFISYDGSYSQTLSLNRVMKGDILVSYQFNGKEFSRIHGFPLRIAAPDEVGAFWVKWLGEIHIE